MGDWDFLYELKGQELLDAQATGATDWDWRYVDEHYPPYWRTKEEGTIKRKREEPRAKKHR